MRLSNTGSASGNLTLHMGGIMSPEDVLKFHPELKEKLDEIAGQGWSFLYIRASGTALVEISGESFAFSMGEETWNPDKKGERPHKILTLDLGDRPFNVVGVPAVDEFRINVSTKSFPRAAALDISKGVVTFLHDPFWRWQDEWKSDARRVSEALEVFDVAQWLVDTKGYKLTEPFTMERYGQVKKALVSIPR